MRAILRTNLWATRFIAITVSAVLTASACAKQTPLLSTKEPEQNERYRIGPPDRLLITVGPEPQIARAVVVRPDGFFAFDLIGEVEAGGRTPEQVRREISERIQQFIVQPDVTVNVEESNSRRFYVFGEVKREGSFPLVGEVTAIEALAAAEGATRFAVLNSAQLTRLAREPGVYPIRYTDITMSADVRTNYELQPGDVIYVPPNSSARIGYALQVVFFPLQQLIGLGGGEVRRVVVR